MLRHAGASGVTFVCDPLLMRLGSRIANVDEVTSIEDFEFADYDLHCPTVSLPYAFRTTLQTIPASDSYLTVPNDLSEQWRSRVSAANGVRVGLAWAGNKTHRDLVSRTLSLDELTPLLQMRGFQFFSLQKGADAAQAQQFDGALTDYMDLCHDFMDTAAHIVNLDLVVTIDTSVAHLAGALGKSVWLLNRAASDWRWGAAGEKCAWYRSMRIFRQSQAGDWTTVVGEVRSALAAGQR